MTTIRIRPAARSADYRIFQIEEVPEDTKANPGDAIVDVPDEQAKDWIARQKAFFVTQSEIAFTWGAGVSPEWYDANRYVNLHG